jgi:hypothetical protein
MYEKVKEHLANLLSLGFTRNQVSEKGYEYALALQLEQEPKGSLVTAAMMAQAAELVKDALPGAYHIYEVRNRMR